MVLLPDRRHHSLDQDASMTTRPFKTHDVLLLSLSHFVHDLYTSFLSPLLPLIIERLSLTLGQAGLLGTLLQLPSLLNPLIGILADRRGWVRWMVILSPSLTAIPMSLIGSVPSYALLLLLFTLAGTSVALFHVPAPVLVAQVSGDRKGRGMSLFMTGGEAARTLGPLAAVGLVSVLGLERFHWVCLLAVLTSVLLYVKLGHLSMETSVGPRPSFRETLAETRHIILPLSGILTARAFMHSAMAVFLPVLIERETGSLWMAGWALVAYEAMGVAGVLSAGTLSDRLGRKQVLFAVLAAAPLAMLGFTLLSGVPRFAMLLVAGFAILATTPVMLALVQENAGRSPAAANGLFMMVSFVVRSLTIVLVGAVGDVTGLSAMFVFSAVMGFLAIPFVLKLR
jgi:FSR family fosmidomycin resistance protein-like MFS transporter